MHNRDKEFVAKEHPIQSSKQEAAMKTDLLTLKNHLEENEHALQAIAKAATREEALNQVRQVADALGLSLTREDFLNALTPPEGELSDAELEAVVGGKGEDDRYTDGDDYVNAEVTDVTMDGGGGDDTLHGNGNKNEMYGGEGDDDLYGGSGNDTLRGDEGNDSLYGGSEQDKLYGGEGDDTLKGASGNDGLSGDSGNDWLSGGEGNDTLYGGEGDDTLFGGTGNDRLYGGDGDDILKGHTGDDKLFGGAGDDTLVGGTGNNVLSGGEGADVFVIGAEGGKNTITDFDVDSDTLQLDGSNSMDDLTITHKDGDTVIQHGYSFIILENVTLTGEELSGAVVFGE